MRLELSDYYIFNLTVYQSLIKKIDGIYRKANWIISVTLAIIIGLIVCHKNLPNQERGNFYLLFVFFFSLIFSFVCLYCFFYFLYKIFRILLKLFFKTINKITYNKKIIPDYLLNISESDIEYDNLSINIRIKWDKILKIIENENALYVYFNKKVAFIFIKRYFENIEEYRKIKNFIENNTKIASVFIVTEKIKKNG